MDTPTLVVMMPALNEAKTIGDVIERIPRNIDGVGRVKVIVVNDGSIDDTERIALDCGAIVVRHAERLGLGRSFADGMDRALREGADIIVNIDSDGQFDPENIVELIAPILQDRADFVTCTRFACREWIPEMPTVKKWGNKRMCNIVNFVTSTTDLTDVSCGFRAFTREAALRMNLFGKFTYTHESIIDLARKGMRLTEVPMRVRGERKYGQSRMASSVLHYGTRAATVILRSMCYLRPLRFFGSIAAGLFGLGLLQWLIIMADWVFAGDAFTTHRFLLLGMSLCFVLAFLVGILALLADMLGRQIRVSEQLLYYARRDDLAGATALATEDTENTEDGDDDGDDGTTTAIGLDLQGLQD
jgi:glycosyltransferase involved in cell wall biosynthesis